MELDTAMELSLWKDEPLSPTLSGLEEVQSDVWQIFNDNGGNKAHSPKNQLGGVRGWLPDSPSDSCDSIKARGQLASQLLDDLDFKDEDSFSDWYETKTDLPMFDALPSPTSSLEAFATRPFASLTPLSGLTPSPFTALAGPAAVLVQALPPIASPLQQQHLLPLVTDTATLLEEFESVFGAVEQSHGGALTPPQSPPHNHYYPVVPQVLQQQQFSPQVQLQPLLSSQYSAPQPTVAVDDQQWPAVSQEAALPFAPPSPCTSSNSSSFCPESPAIPSPPSPASSGSDDPDWDPSSVEEYTPTPTKSSGSGGRKRSVKRSKPYSSEDKRIRKKEQNKNAATRYRMKKKAEVEEILGEENELREKNDELTAKVADISQEIRYLKGLMRELFRSRGLIK